MFNQCRLRGLLKDC